VRQFFGLDTEEAAVLYYTYYIYMRGVFVDILWLIPLVLLGILVLVLLVGFVVYLKVFRRLALNPKGETIEESDTVGKLQAQAQAAGREYLFSLHPQDVSHVAKDGLTLRGYFIHAPLGSKNSDKLAILVHGHHADGAGNFAPFLRFYHEVLGWHILLPDQRTHGRSDGRYITFGARESRDILGWARDYIRVLGKDIKIALHGISMGGATVLLCGEQTPPPQIKCIVNDCGFSDALQVVAYNGKKLIHVPCRPVALAVGFWSRQLGRGSFRKDAAPLRNISKMSCPVLTVHGETDDVVPYTMGQKIHEACPAEKTFLSVPNCGHNQAWYLAQDAYKNALRMWFARWMPTADEELTAETSNAT
jgi:fermentation-respiration switch protein FrsA (DUF1100 family)